MGGGAEGLGGLCSPSCLGRAPSSGPEVEEGRGGPSLTAWQGHLARVLRTQEPPPAGASWVCEPPWGGRRCLGWEKPPELGALGALSCATTSAALSFPTPLCQGRVAPCQLAKPEGQDKAERVAFSGLQRDW